MPMPTEPLAEVFTKDAASLTKEDIDTIIVRCREYRERNMAKRAPKAPPTDKKRALDELDL